MEFKKISDEEDGFVLVVALMVMVILSLIGIAGLNTSIFEEQIAGNEWNAKRSFYKADGGISTGVELLEQNFNCPIGFKKTDPVEGTILVRNMKFSSNPPMSVDSIKTKLNDPVNKYDAAYPSDTNVALPTLDVGYLYFGGQTKVLPGGALQMAAGYEGKGKASAQGGVATFVNVYSQFLGPRGSEAIILSGWRHLIGTEGSCIY
ncbi:PilX N-terminal domain-containing pilus assembly protein [Desulfocastanea catecholica]